jgi:hypothetical protein
MAAIEVAATAVAVRLEEADGSGTRMHERRVRPWKYY